MLKAKIENKGLRTLYVRKKDSDTHHWHPSCPHFQRYEFDKEAVRQVRTDRPTTGELCSLCLAKEKRERSGSY